VSAEAKLAYIMPSVRCLDGVKSEK